MNPPPEPGFSIARAEPAVVSRLPAAAPYLLFLAVTGIVFGPALVRGDYPARGDVLTREWPWRHVEAGPPEETPVGMSDPVTYFYPSNRLAADAIREGRLPFWNPHLMCGYPPLASGQNGVFYPPKWLLFRMFELPRAMTLHLALHFWGAGAAMAWLLRGRGGRPFGASVGGLAWMLCEANAFYLQFDALLAASVWLPLTLGCAGRAFERRSAAWACAGGLAFGLGLLGAYLQRMYYAGLLVLAWGMIRGVGEAWKAKREGGPRWLGAGAAPPMLAGLALALGAAAGAAAVVPFAEVLRDPVRQAVPYEILFGGGWQRWMALPTLALPRLLGGDLDTLSLWGKEGARIWTGTTFREFTAYCGVLPLALALGAAFGARRRAGALFSAAAAAALLLAMGTPLSRLAYHLLPGFDRAEPTRLFWVWAFGVCGLAGLGADAMTEAPGAAAWRRLGRALWAGAALLAAVGAACMAAVAVGAGPVGLRWGSLGNPALASGLVGLAGAAAVIHAARSGWPTRALAAPACVVVAADLLALLLPMNPVTAPSRLYPEMPVFLHLREEAARTGVPFRVVMRRAMPWWEWPIPNAAAVYGLDTPEGHEAIRPAAFTRFVAAVSGRGGAAGYARDIDFSHVEGIGRVLSFLNVRYVVGDPGETLPLEGWKRIDLPDAVLYENPSVQPRAFTVAWERAEVIPDRATALARLAAPGFDYRASVVVDRPLPPLETTVVPPPFSQGTVTYTRPAPDAIALKVQVDGQAVVVISDAYDEGWEATLNGEPCPLLRANHAFRAVAVPWAGTWRIEMKYRPRWWPWAGWGSLAAAAVGGVAWAAAAARNRKSQIPNPK